MNKERNKGFSLVELIIVVAIMAILGVVLAPSYLRYVEKTRFSKDNDGIYALKSAVEVALADETIYTAVASETDDPVISLSTTGYSWTNGVDSLTNEVAKTLAAGDVKLTSKTYIQGTAPTITVDTATMKVTLQNVLTSPTN